MSGLRPKSVIWSARRPSADQEGSTEVALDEADLVSERARTHMQVFRSGAEVGIPDYPGEAL